MRAVFLMVCLGIVGCETTQSQTLGGCGDDSSAVDVVADGGQGGGFPVVYEDGGIGGEGGAPGLLPGGAPCSTDSDCAYATCLPSGAFSYCFDRLQEGCMVVTTPDPVAALCVPKLNKVYVCGDSWDVATLGACTDIATGALGEPYYCCAP